MELYWKIRHYKELRLTREIRNKARQTVLLIGQMLKTKEGVFLVWSDYNLYDLFEGTDTNFTDRHRCNNGTWAV